MNPNDKPVIGADSLPTSADIAPAELKNPINSEVLESPLEELNRHKFTAVDQPGGAAQRWYNFKRRKEVVLVVLVLIFIGALSFAIASFNNGNKNNQSQDLNKSNFANVDGLAGSIAANQQKAVLQINYDTDIAAGKTLTANGAVIVQNDSTDGFKVQNAGGNSLLVADTANGRVGIGGAPTGAAKLQVNGNLSVNGQVVSTNGAYSLSPQGLALNGVLVCTSAGCTSQQNLTGVATLAGNNSFTGVNKFTAAGNVFAGDGSGISAISAGNIASGTLSDNRLSGNVALANGSNSFTGNNSFASLIQAAGGIDAAAYSVNGNSGATISCSASDLLQQAIIQGGIITGGNCVPGGGASIATLQESYDASVPAKVVLSSASGMLQLQDGNTPLGTNLFEVTSNGGGTRYFAVSAAGAAVTGTFNATTLQQNGVGVLTQNTNFSGDVSGTYNSLAIGVGAVNSSKILDGTISNTDISGTAAIDYSKLNLAGSIVNADISAAASISYSKLNLAGSVTNSDIAAGAGISYSKLSLNNSIVNADIGSSAAIAYGKLNLAGSVTNSDISGTAGIAYGKLNLSGSIQDSDVSASSHFALTNANQTFSGTNTFNNSIAAPGITAGGAALGIGASGDTLNLNGTYGSTLAVTDGTHTTTVGFSGTPTANVAYDFDVSAAAGAYTICTTAGNCTGVAGGSIGGSGTAGKIAKFTGSGFTIGDSILSDNGTTVSVGGTLDATTLQQGGTGVLLQTTSFSGDVSGTYNSLSVDKLKGTALSINTLTSGQFLQFDGSNWINQAISGDITVDNTGAASIGASKVTSLQIADGTIANADISGTAAIGYSKLNLAGSVTNSDISGTAGIGYSKLNLGGSIQDSDVSASSHFAFTNAANTFTAAQLIKVDNAGALQIQDSLNDHVLTVDTLANKVSINTLNFAGTGNVAQAITKSMVVSSAVNAHDILILDTASPGEATTTSTAKSNLVYGVATTSNIAGQTQDVVIGGTYQVNVDATSTIAVGDFIATSSTPGEVTTNNNPAAGTILGRALSAITTPGAGQTVWVQVTPDVGGGSAGSGVSAIGTIDTQTKSADGAVIAGTTLYLQTADAGAPGLVSTGAQTFAGDKTFNGVVSAATLQQGGTGVLLQNTAFSGDVSGVYNSTSVDKLKGTALSIGSLSNTNFLIYNSTSGNWENHSVSGDITIDHSGVAAIGAGKVTGSNILDGTIANADISGTAAIDYGKLNLAGSIQDGDVSASSHFAFTNANQTFTGDNTFQLLGNPLTVEDASSPLGTNLFEVTDHAGTTKYFTVSATALQFNGNDVCTAAGNCTGVAGGSIGGSGTTGKIAKFTGSGYTVGDSLISDNGTTVSVGGVLAVNTITPTATLTVGTPTQTLTLQGDASTSLSATSGGVTNSLVFAAPTLSGKTITLPDASGTVAVSASGPLSLDAAGNLTCPTCLTSGGGTAGVTDVNGANGSITLAGTTNQIIITPNSGTFTFSTPQDIDTTSSVDFANVNVSSSLKTGGTARIDVNGNLTNINNVDVTGSVAAKAGTDFSATGVSNDVSFGNVSLVRLTGTSTQTITGIAGGRDGYQLTIVNAGTQAAVISNNSASSLAANRVTTGTGADYSLPTGSGIGLVYDATASLWRLAATGTGINSVGAIDTQGPSADGATIVGNSIYLQSASATATGLVNTATQSFAGDKTFSGLITGQTGLSVSGGAVTLQGNTASSLTTTSGALTLQGADGTSLLTAGAAGATSSDITISSGNVTSGAFASGNVNIDVGTSTGTTGTINIGTANASTVSIGVSGKTATVNGALTVSQSLAANAGITVASGQSIVLNGGNTASRPASPTKGTLYYDTATNNLISYNGTKWISAPKSNTLIVAASNSTQAEKDAADYIATGSGDQATINSALSALPASGGSVYLMEGTYTISAAISVPNNTTLEGAGASTIITLPSAQNGTYNMIQNSDTSTGTNVTISNLLIDGNKANQTAGTMNGVYFNEMGAGSGAVARSGGKIMNTTVKNIYGNTSAAITIQSSANNLVANNTIKSNSNLGMVDSGSTNDTFTGNLAQGNNNSGIYISNSSYATVTGNTAQGNSTNGISIFESLNSTVTGNTISGNSTGIQLLSFSSGAYGNSVVGNAISGNTSYGIEMQNSVKNTISGNKLHDNGSNSNNSIYLLNSSTQNSITDNDVTDSSCAATCYAINISDSGSTGNYLASNHFLGDGTHAASINDATASGNTYSNQPLTENGDASFRNGTNSATAFQIQNASGSSLFNVDSSGSILTTELGTLSLDTANADHTINIGTGGSGGGSFPQNGVIDNFNRTNNATLGTGWAGPVDPANSSTWQVNSNQALDNHFGGNTDNYRTDISAADTEAYFTIEGQTDEYDVMARVQNPNTASAKAYLVDWDNGTGQIQIYKNVNNVYTALGSPVTVAQAIGDRLAITAVGNIITGYADTGSGWTQEVQVTDNSITGPGSVGVLAASQNDRIDDFGGGAENNTNSQQITIGSANASSGVTLQAGAGNIQLLSAGSSIVKSLSDNAAAFQVQNSSGDVLLNVDTSAPAITLSANTTIAAGKSLTMAGGNTASRPGSATAGTLYYDTNTNQLLQYNGTKWVSDRSSSTKIVAASNSTQAEKDAADYIATGSGDESVINSALTAAAGGTVYLMEGTYTVAGPINVPNSTTLAGAGASTIITLPAAQNGFYSVITNSDTGTGHDVTIRDLTINGNKTSQTGGTMNGIFFNNNMIYGRIADVSVGFMYGGYGIYMTGTYNTSVTDNSVHDNGGPGISLQSGTGNTFTNNNSSYNQQYGIDIRSSSNVISNNQTTYISGYGIYLNSSANNNTVVGNIALGNNGPSVEIDGSYNTASNNTISSPTSPGIEVEGSSNTISGNSATSGTSPGIVLGAANKNNITGNNIYNSGGSTGNQGLFLNSSSNNNITGNNITDNSCSGSCYAINIFDSGSAGNYLSSNTFSGDGTNAATINDAGTGTIYSNQQLTSNGDAAFRNGTNSATAFQIQNAGGADTLFTANTNTRASGTAGNTVKIGNSTGTDTDTTILVLDSASAAPTTNLGSLSGGLFYNSNSGHIDVVENGAVKELCNKTDLGCGSAVTPTLAQVYGYGAGSADETIGLVSGKGGVLIRDNSTPIGSTLFGVQDSTGSTKYLDVTTGGISVNGTSLSGTALTFGGAAAASIDAASGQTLSVGAAANAHITTIGSTTGASTTNIQSGTSGINLVGNVNVNGSGNFTVNAGNTSLGGNLDVTGSLAAKKGTDISTTGSLNNLNFGNASLIRMTGASAQTITGLVNSGGNRDGEILTIVNAGTAALTINDNDSNSLAANRIRTGTGSPISVAVNSSQTLVYDAGALLWRVVGDVAGGSGAGVTSIGTINTQSKSADGAVITGNSLVLQTADANWPGLVSTASQNFSGAKTFAALITGQAGLTVSGGVVSLQGNAASQLTTSTGNLTLTATAASSQVLIDAGTAGSGTVAIGTTNASVINVGSNNAVHTITIGSTSGAAGAQVISIGGNGNTSNTIAIDSGTGSNGINIGNSSTGHTINIGAGGTSNQNVNIGSSSGSGTVVIQGGTGNSLQLQSQGSILIGNNNIAQNITIGNGTGATSVAIQCGTGACGVGNNATDHTTTIGSTTGSSQTLVQSGTSGISLQGNTTLTASSYIKITGSGTRPSSPTAGTLYYDTSTNQLIQYNGTKWVSAPKSNTFIVAASNSTQAEKDAADYVATGTGDQTVINNIFINNAPCNTTGCSVYLMEGTYTLSAAISVPNNTTLSGAGAGTIITVPNAQNGSYSMIQNTDTSTGTNVTIENLLLDGNGTNQSSGSMTGIYFNHVGASSRIGGSIRGTVVQNITNGWGIYAGNSYNNVLTGNNVSTGFNTSYGIELFSSSTNTVTNNVTNGNDIGIFVQGSSNNTISDNVASGNTGVDGSGILVNNSSSSNNITNNVTSGNELGIYLAYGTSGSSNNTVSGNSVSSNTIDGIALSGSTGALVSGNKIDGSGASSHNNGINLSNTSTKNSITSNDITDSSCTSDCYAINIADSGSTGNYFASNHFLGDGTHAASIHDATTGGNTYSNQPLTENGDASFRNGTNSASAFQVQNSAGRDLLNIDTSASTLSVGNTTDGSQISLAASGNANATITKNMPVTGTVNAHDLVVIDSANDGHVTDTTTANDTKVFGIATSSSTPQDIVIGGTYQVNLITTNQAIVPGDYLVSTTTAGQVDKASGVPPSGTAIGQALQTVAANTGGLIWVYVTPGEGGTGVGGSTTLQQAYDYSTGSPQITLDASPGAGGLVVQDNASALTGNLFTVQGNGCVSASCKYLDVSATGAAIAGTLSVSGALTANGGISVASGQSIVLTGSGTRPSSPTKGTLYYDTSTNQLISYNGTKWTSAPKSSTIIVAASNSTQAEKDAADYVAAGSSDEVTINSALSALPAGGGSVYLMEGTYTLSSSISVPNNTTLTGAGAATVITIPNAQNGSYGMIQNTDTSTGTNVTVSNLLLDGNKGNQTAGNMNGIYFTGMGGGSGSTARDGGKISGVVVDKMHGNGTGIYLVSSANSIVSNSTVKGDGYGIWLNGSSYITVSGNVVQGNLNTCISLSGGSGNTLSGNTLQGTTGDGINMSSSSSGNTITGNNIVGNSTGIRMFTPLNNTITGNTIQGNSSQNVYFNGGSGNIVSGNKILNSGGSSNNDSIYLSNAATGNSFIGNDITDSVCNTTCYAINISDAGSTGNYISANHFLGDGTHAATIHDATTSGNTYANQPLTESGDASFRNGTNSATAFQIQNSTNGVLMAADTSSMRVSIGSIGTAIGQLYVAGSVPTVSTGSVTTGGGPQMALVSGNYLFAVQSSANTLASYDISNPASPVQINTFATGTAPKAFAIQGHFAYVVNSTGNSLQIIDISNPNSMSLDGTLATGASTSPKGIVIQGRYAYITNFTSSTLQIVDISNPLNPVSVSTTATSCSGPQYPAIAGRYIYFPCQSVNKFEIMDVSNPAAPSVVGASVTTNTKPEMVQIAGRYLYVVSSTGNSLQIFDVSNPGTVPAAVGSVSTGASTAPEALYIQGRYAYVSDTGANAMQTVDISNPAAPALVGTAVTTDANPEKLVVVGRYAYVPNSGSTSIQVFDVGGAYIQQLQSGGIEASTLSVDSNAVFGSDVNIQGGVSIGQSLQVQGGVSVAQSISLNGNLSSLGAASFTDSTNSANALQVSNSSATALLTVNTLSRSSGTAGNTINIGTGAGSDTATTVLVLDSSNGALTTNLASLNGGMFYNTSTGHVDVVESGTVKELCNQTDKSCGGNSTTLQQGYTASTGGTTSEIIADATRGALDVQDRSTTNGGTLGGSLLTIRATAANDSTQGSALFDVQSAGTATFSPTGNVASVLVRQTSYGSPTADILDVQNSAGTQNFLSFNLSGGVPTLKVYDSTGTNYASISYSGGAAIFAASSGTTQIGSGSGPISFALTNQTDNLTINHTSSLSSNISNTFSDVTITRNFTQGTFTSGSGGNDSSVLTVQDTSTASSASNIASDILVLNQSNASAGGNILNAQSGGTSIFSVANSGNVTAANNISIGAGKSYTGSGTVTLQSGGANALNLDTGGGAAINIGGANATSLVLGGNTSATITEKVANSSTSAYSLQTAGGTSFLTVNSTSGRITIGASDTTGTLLVLDTDTDAAFSGGSATNSAAEVDGAMFYSSTNHDFMCGVAGAWETCNGLLYSNTAASTAINTCTNTCGAFNTPVPIPANYCQPGRSIHIMARGTWGDTTTATSYGFGFYYGTDATTRTNDTALGTGTPVFTVTPTSQTGLPWSLDVTIICYSASSMSLAGTYTIANNATLTTTNVVMQMQPTTTGVTSTTAKNLYIFPSIGVSNASNTVTLQQLVATGN